MKTNNKTEASGGFSSSLGVILASAGSAVGLGNLLFVTGRVDEYGALFFIPYTIFMVILGLPLMIGEFSLGRSKQKTSLEAYDDAPSVGIIGVFASLAISLMYFILGGAVMLTIIYSFTAESSETISEYLFSVFSKGDDLKMNPWALFAATAIFIAANYFILIHDISSGLQRLSSIVMPLLFASLIILAIYALIDGDGTGDLSKIFTKWDHDFVNGDSYGYGSRFSVVGAAAAKAFLSLSLGIAIITTFGSYTRKEDSIVKNSVLTTVMDWSVVLIASVSTIALGSWFAMPPLMVAFLMIVVLFAALTSSVSLQEAVVSSIADKVKKDKNTIHGAFSLFILVFSTFGIILTALGVTSWVTSLDTFSERNILLLSGIFLSIYLGWKAKPWDEMNNEILGNYILPVAMKYFIPLILLYLWFNQIGAWEVFK